MKEQTPEGYYQAILRIRQRMNHWRKEHPTKKVQIIFPAKIMVIGEIYLALESGFVKCNKEGYEMLKAMCEPESDQPTVTMVRTAIEGGDS